MLRVSLQMTGNGLRHVMQGLAMEEAEDERRQSRRRCPKWREVSLPTSVELYIFSLH